MQKTFYTFLRFAVNLILFGLIGMFIGILIPVVYYKLLGV